MTWFVLAIVTGLGLGGGIAYGVSAHLDARRRDRLLPAARVVALGSATSRLTPAVAAPTYPDDDCPECGASDAGREIGTHHAAHCSGYPKPAAPPPDQYGTFREPGESAWPFFHVLDADERRLCDGGPVTRVWDASYLHKANPHRRCRMPACRLAWDTRLTLDQIKRAAADAEERERKARRERLIREREHNRQP